MDTPSPRPALTGATQCFSILWIRRRREVDIRVLTPIPNSTDRPVRISLGGQCPALNSTLSVTPTPRVAPRPPASVQGSIVLGPVQGSGTSQEKVPVYVRAMRDLARLGFALSIGDQQSQLHFEPASGIVPSILEDSQRGVIAGAWAGGLDLSAGRQVLLGYVVGPAGSGANLKVFGVSASGLNDFAEVGLDVAQR
jgi:hypothetical protein